MMWVILGIVAVVLVVLIILSMCTVSGNWDELEQSKFVFVLECTYWIKSEKGKQYYTLKEAFATYDKLEDELTQAVFNPYFVSAMIGREKNGD